MGLHPHGIAADTITGAAHIARAIAALDLAHLSDRPVPDLSGGEAQRVHLARVLVQVEAALAAGTAPLLLLDEPATGLDWRHQFALGRLLRQLAARGATIVLSLHDLALARALDGDVLLLAKGRLQAAGPVAEILSPAMLARWFDLAADEAALLAA
jgi:iron complex transport system ATP-binding protein